MNEYHKIHSLYKRDDKGKFLFGQWSRPEFGLLQDIRWVGTEKIDGTNIRICLDRDKNLSILGKTAQAQIPKHLLAMLTEVFTVERMKDVFRTEDTEADVCLYGEGCGTKIQKGGGNYNPTGTSFVLFDVKIGHWWMTRANVSILGEKLGVPVVSEVYSGPLCQAEDMVRHGFQSAFGAFLAEGLVLRPMYELKDRAGERIITKLKHKDYL